MAQARPTRQVVLASLLLIALPFALFWRVWWPNAQERRVFARGDFVGQHYPMRAFVAGELRGGRLPLWDPYTFGGEPASAESLFSTFYPPSLWQAIFPGRLPFMALEIEAIAHLSLAGLFTFLLVRRLTGRTVAGLVAGMAFGLGGFLTSYPMLQIIILQTATWLPAGLWLLERALPSRSLAGVGLAGAVLGVAILAGHAQTFLYVAYAVGGYLILRAWRLRLGWRFTAAAALILGGVALGLSAVQWLPSLQLLALSPHAHMSYEAVSAGFPPRAFWGLLRPNPGEWSPLYVGLIPLSLAMVGVVLRRQAEIWYWAILGLLAALISLGGDGPLFRFAYACVPGLGLFRDQERLALLISFALALLAGYGCAALAKRCRWPWQAWLILLALTAVDLFHANSGVILQAPRPGGYFASSPVVQYLQQVADPNARLSSEGLLPGGANAGLVFKLRDVTGNGPLYVADYEKFLDTVPELRWWQLLNVRYVLTRRLLNHGALRPVLDDGDRHLYQVSLGAQPAWICHDVRLVAGVEAAIQQTADPALDPLHTAILERAPEPVPQPATGPEEVRVVARGRQWLAAEVTLSAPGVVAFSEVWYPGWVVRVNGQRMPALRAYGVLRAIALPAGHFRAEWHYEPVPFYAGAGLSLATVLGVGLLCWGEHQARRKAVTVLGREEKACGG